MALTIRAQVTLERQNGQPEDAIVNTWHFLSNRVDPADAVDDANGPLIDFYNAIDGQFSSIISGAWQIKWYSLNEPTPRVPIITTPADLTTATGTPLPAECAICLSYAAGAGSGDSVRRRRGRIYLGPWDGVALDEAANDGRVQSATQSLIVGAVNTMGTALLLTDTNWAVFSPTTAGPEPWSAGELVAATHFVSTFYVDNAWDTVRSRGLAPDSRVSDGFPI